MHWGRRSQPFIGKQLTHGGPPNVKDAAAQHLFSSTAFRPGTLCLSPCIAA